MKIFTGVCTALITPFTDDKVDFEALGKIIDFQIESKVDALCILGTTGEASTLTFGEKLEIAEYSIKKVNGRIPIIFGIGGNNPKEIIKLGLGLKELGAAAVMLTAPYYNKCTQAACIKYFHTIADTIELPMVVYNIPGRTGMNIEAQTMQKIAANKYIAGIKEASGNMSQIIETVRLCPDTAVYCGDDGISLPCYAVGCQGIISVASNVRPAQTRKIWSDFQRCNSREIFLDTPNKASLDNSNEIIFDNSDSGSGDNTHSSHDNSRETFFAELPCYRALFCEINPGPIKYAMHLAGFCKPDVRPPLTQPTDASIIQYGFRQFFKSTCDTEHDGNK